MSDPSKPCPLCGFDILDRDWYVVCHLCGACSEANSEPITPERLEAMGFARVGCYYVVTMLLRSSYLVLTPYSDGTYGFGVAGDEDICTLDNMAELRRLLAALKIPTSEGK